MASIEHLLSAAAPLRRGWLSCHALIVGLAHTTDSTPEPAGLGEDTVLVVSCLLVVKWEFVSIVGGSSMKSNADCMCSLVVWNHLDSAVL